MSRKHILSTDLEVSDLGVLATALQPTRHTVIVTTIVGGTATAYTTAKITGRILGIRYVKTDFTNGVDFTIVGETTATPIWTQVNVDASVTVAPRQATCDTAGVASLYAAGGEPVEDYIVLADERISITIAQGGDLKVGTFHFLIG